MLHRPNYPRGLLHYLFIRKLFRICAINVDISQIFALIFIFILNVPLVRYIFHHFGFVSHIICLVYKFLNLANAFLLDLVDCVADGRSVGLLHSLKLRDFQNFSFVLHILLVFV